MIQLKLVNIIALVQNGKLDLAIEEYHKFTLAEQVQVLALAKSLVIRDTRFIDKNNSISTFLSMVTV